MFSFSSVLKTAALALLAFALPAGAAELGKPKGEVILTVTGKIDNTNAAGKVEFDRAMLDALGVSELKTSHSWADGVSKFEGIQVSKLLDAVGAKGSKLKAVAINDYAIELEIAEMRKYPVMLAMRMNDAELRRRDRGPIWVVYPRDSFAELKDEKHNSKWIWQVKTLEIQ